MTQLTPTPMAKALHAILAPSSAPRWVLCPGSVTLEALYPETEPDPDALDGEASHWAASETLNDRETCEGQVAPNGVTLLYDMLAGADMYTDDVFRTFNDCARFDRNIELHVEERILIPFVHKENDGTPDCWFFTHDQTTGKATIYLWDYKFGHRYVDPFEHYQLIDYLCGIRDKLGIDGLGDQRVDVVMRVVQPRNFHRDGPIREWRCKLSDLRGYFNMLRSAAAEALGPNPTCHVNPYCGDCRGRHACEALTRAELAASDTATSSLPLVLPAAALGAELRRVNRTIELLKARQSGLEQAAFHAATRGERVPYFMLAAGSGRLKWTKPAAHVITLGQLVGLNLAAPAEAVTPTQALSMGLDPSLVAANAKKFSGAKTLVPDDGQMTRKAFGGGK